MKPIQFVHLMVGIALLMFFIPNPHAAASPTSTLKLAILVPLTGPVPAFGSSARDGALLAIDQQNSGGGILGSTIESVIEDTSCDAAKAVNATDKVISQDGVKYIIGDVCSNSTIQMTGITNAAGVMQMTPTATNPAVTVGSEGQVKEYVFRACFIDSFQGTAAARFTRGSLSAQNAFILSNLDSSYSMGLANAFETEFSKSANIVANEPYTNGDTDFSAILDKIIAIQPDVIYLPDYYTKVNLITSQAKAKGITIPFVGGDGWDSAGLDAIAADGGYFITHFSMEDSRPEVSAFEQAFMNAYGYSPDTIAALTYDATKLIFQAMLAAGTTDATIVKTNLASISFQGVTGTLFYNPQHNPIKSAAVMSVSGVNGIYFFATINPEEPVANLSINYTNGSPGSYFILNGAYFPPNAAATITINDQVVAETIPANSSGGFVFRLDTTAAEEGQYLVTASVNPSAAASFTLENSAPQRILEGNGTVISVALGVAYTDFNFLPLVQR